MKPILLDLFGCEGVGASGYAKHFEVWSVDNDKARADRNPFSWFVGDWREGLDRALQTGQVVAGHASPPCQPDTAGLRSHRARGEHLHGKSLIPAVREALRATGLPFVIENVQGAELLAPVVLCGSQFGLRTVDDDGTVLHLRRHRLFESNVPLHAPAPCKHPRGVQWAGAYGGARRDKHEARNVRHGGYVPPNIEVLRSLLGAPQWASEKGMFECIPPAYGAHIGAQLAAVVATTKQVAA